MRIVIFFLFLISNCATILSPKTYPLFIESNVDNLELTLVYPSKIKLKSLPKKDNVIFIHSNEPCNLIFKKSGFQTINVEIEYKINPAIIGNLYFPGILFLPVDIINGYNKKPAESNFQITMVPEEKNYE